jgi:hypothetical protein
MLGEDKDRHDAAVNCLSRERIQARTKARCI